MRKWIVILLMLLIAAPVGMAASALGENDTVSAWQQPIRRLHPERERAKAMKKLQEQMSHKAEEKADPWDTSDEVWGTVDVPAAVRDSNAVVGRRLRDVSEADEVGGRLAWRDVPVTTTIDQLMPYFTINENGECHSKYVSDVGTSSEVYFAFNVSDSLPGPLRLCVRYCADVPVEFGQLTFTIDGYDYMFYPAEVQCLKVNGNQYLACSDDVLQPAGRYMVYALAHGHWVILKLHCTDGVTRVKVLTDGQREDFSFALDMYRLLGGDL